MVVAIVKPLLLLFTRRDWRDRDNLPRAGGVIIAANHLSWSDPLLLSHYAYVNGRWPVFLAKSGLFEIPVIGWIIRKCRQIPVLRGSTDAARSLRHAEDALREGACVIFYPEGTITRDPGHWPMMGKTGVARLALVTGVPVIPVAHWGAQELLPYGQKAPRPFPRKTIRVVAGPPVDLSKYEGLPMRGKVLKDATADIMAAITAQLGELRGEKAPDVPFAEPETRAG
ncbi:lysophospholipid acyltransferase family protein [Sphaerisporangium sp. TRM90804]|uniref:lysophospholipid acyltransferase family protein n=1 Tax=Sphaerisporangium sp. TRM90804 TaxID=3031113 RepID=UPI00244B3633|nr:lysophospholipid acyltransferase family protein [Sphaerisporangium sp. TRM90804]MDH2427606.1 lysophospholipid acyltransferase family protein [Sphaerisporangium sp. TRM90804]